MGAFQNNSFDEDGSFKTASEDDLEPRRPPAAYIISSGVSRLTGPPPPRMEITTMTLDLADMQVSRPDPATPTVKSSGVNDACLQRMGQKQKLQRNMRLLSAIAFTSLVNWRTFLIGVTFLLY